MSMRIESASLGWAAAGLRVSICRMCAMSWRSESRNRRHVFTCCCVPSLLLWVFKTLEDEEWAKSRGFCQVSFDASPLYVHFLLKTEGVLSTVELLHLLETIDISDSLGQSFWKNSNTASEILSSSETICFNLRCYMLQNVYGAVVHETY